MKINARFVYFFIVLIFLGDSLPAIPIDRKALVERHQPHNTSADIWSPFTVGNGQFAMTVDITGLQTFADKYAEGIPLSILSDWGWHSFPDEGYQLEDTMEIFSTGDRLVPYPTKQTSPAGQWLRSNPHRLGLGRIGFEIYKKDGTPAKLEDLTGIDQMLNLWGGFIESHFEVEGVPVRVRTAVHPELDVVTVNIDSTLLTEGRLKIFIAFPYGNPAWGIEPEDWTSVERHVSRLTTPTDHQADIFRTLDGTHYGVTINYDPVCQIVTEEQHEFSLRPARMPTFSADFHFWDGTEKPKNALFHESVGDAATRHWQKFWKTGGAIDFSGSTDPRAHELERRVILSQYLTAIQCAGTMPPQETGLTFNSWYGVAHLEMHWWHGVHFALWNRLQLLERSLPWYRQISPAARDIAERQDYEGVRWPKMVDRDGREKPSAIAPLLIWQQPHPIYFAELVYRQKPYRETLLEYKDIVFETADFMASFAIRNEETGEYDLGPPLIPAQESFDPKTTRNPPFELTYWKYGLETARLWRERLDLESDPEYARVLGNLASLPLFEDGYASAEGIWNTVDHPSVLAALGMLPGKDVDHNRMLATLKRVIREYDWTHTWGWDYPMMAMTAARLGEPEMAVDLLMMDVPKNRYLPNGHNFQENRALRIYLPGNGGLLTAVAMMAAGWDGMAEDLDTPGFPDDGSWQVRWENLRKMP